MSKTLDRRRPYGEVWGGMTNARFHQDNTYFDAQGKALDEVIEHDVEGAAPPLPAPPPAGVVTGTSPEAVVDAQTLLNARRGELMPKAIGLLEAKSEDVIGELPDHSIELLTVLLEIEALTRKRKGVTDAILQQLEAKRTQEAQDEAAVAGQPIAPPKGPATATFGTMAGESQLANQLQG